MGTLGETQRAVSAACLAGAIFHLVDLGHVTNPTHCPFLHLLNGDDNSVYIMGPHERIDGAAAPGPRSLPGMSAVSIIQRSEGGSDKS